MVKAVKIMIGLVAAFLLFVTVNDYIQDYRDAYQEELTSTNSVPGEEVEIWIPNDSSAKEVAEILEKNELIRFKRAFVKRLQESEYKGKLQAGTFTLRKGMNTLEMMKVMSQVDDSAVVVKQLLIPEGYSVDLIATKCEEEGICKKSEFINAVKSITADDFEYLADVPSGVPVRYKLEGYLFPATYDITKDTKAIDLVHMMLNAFNAYYTAEMKSQALERGYNSYEILTIASMIEREARIDSERAKISSVIYNRLENDMLLQIDSTTLYPLTNGMYDIPNISTNDLSLDSPYNTYVTAGLPIGPICNPGLACINAAISPEETSYLYYHIIDEEKGEHIFTETFEEHNASQIGGLDTDGDGIADTEKAPEYEDNNAEDDVWSNRTD